MAAKDQLPVSPKRRHDKRHHGHHHHHSHHHSKGQGRTLTTPSMGRHESPMILPREFSNPEVQESDGNFFESFTALAWRQENRRLRAVSEDGKEGDRPPPSEVQYVNNPPVYQLSSKEYEDLYVEVLYTIKHKIGTTSGQHSPYIQDLYQYAKEAFGVSPEDHARLLAKATEEKPPTLILNLFVNEARGLEAKDADGFSDPYCMLGIMPSANQAAADLFSSDEESNKPKDKDKKGLKKFSASLRKKKDKASSSVRELLPAKLIKTTSVKPNTLNPVWNERFHFNLDDVNTDRLHLDIWDHDEEFSVVDAAKKLNEVQGFKGLGRFFKQVAQSARSRSNGNVDDFLGCVNVPLADIPSTGLTKWFPLEGRSARSNIQGEIKLTLSLATREDHDFQEETNWTDVAQHIGLVSIFVEHEIKRSTDPSYKWNGSLPQVANTILHQHAIQGDITESQAAACRWIAYSRKHVEHPLDYRILLAHLEAVEKTWIAENFSIEEEEALAESFTLFLGYCLSLLRKVRDVFPPSNRAAFQRLQDLLKCLATTYELKVFKKCCPFQRELTSELKSMTKKGTLEWYERIYSHCRTQPKREEDPVQSLIELVNLVNTDLYRAYNNYTAVYERFVGIRYFHIVYVTLEKALRDEVGEDLGRTLRQEGQSDREYRAASAAAVIMGTSLFELYLALQEFCKYTGQLSDTEQKAMTLLQYFKWFETEVSKWLELARQKAERRIYKSIELDKAAQVDECVKYSTSAVDVTCCFAQITEFWKQLAWPDPVSGYKLIQRLTTDLCECALVYADLVHDKLTKAGYYDIEGQFDVTEQLCITINNIEQVRQSLKTLPDALGFARVDQTCQVETLTDIIQEADDKMATKIKQVVDRVADKMRQDIKKDVFHLNWAPESLPADDAVGDLLEYLDSNLLTLNNNLLKANFERILSSIWEEVLEEFREVIDTEEMRPAVFYHRMYDAINLLVDFFHANGKGLMMEEILTPDFKNLRLSLTYHKMDTLALIEAFFDEKVEHQKELESSEYGILSLRVVYKADLGTLLVEILSAKDLIPLDANGLSDPFVLLQLCPAHVFPTLPVQSTKVVKKTLQPVWDESFEFPVTPMQCHHKGATLLLTVMDHDLVFQNDFAGEVYISLAEVPGVDGEEVTGFEALNIMSMPLTHPKQRGTSKILEILNRRTWDKEAQEFVKKRSKVEEEAG